MFFYLGALPRSLRTSPRFARASRFRRYGMLLLRSQQPQKFYLDARNKTKHIRLHAGDMNETFIFGRGDNNAKFFSKILPARDCGAVERGGTWGVRANGGTRLTTNYASTILEKLISSAFLRSSLRWTACSFFTADDAVDRWHVFETPILKCVFNIHQLSANSYNCQYLSVLWYTFVHACKTLSWGT